MIRIDYDDQLEDVVSRISSSLKEFGIEIVWIPGERDGFELYEIKKIEKPDTVY